MSDKTTSTSMDNFVALSVLLTGVSENTIAPFFDTFDIKTQIYTAAEADNAAALTALLGMYSTLIKSNKPTADIIQAIMTPPTSETGRMARSIILAWYSGSWYTTSTLFTEAPSTRVLSSGAYEQGLMWKVAQAHAMGSADYPFGYWNENPPALSQFIGGSQA
ncbi:sugar dehydrogenase complex small subunit [Rhizobium sp.]|jgi:hypothetical protein|uniref:sugar dehydrogenase complex small subunit n=1 Tax=Rhizobium sp. TaxID=391 RepID=UPI002AA8CB7D